MTADTAIIRLLALPPIALASVLVTLPGAAVAGMVAMPPARYTAAFLATVAMAAVFVIGPELRDS
jgi:hypothetical protein